MPFTARFGLERDRRRALLEQVQLYERLYPGGTHHVQAVRTELETLFEIASCDTADFEPLRTRVGLLLRGDPVPAVAEEAAYWEILCERLVRTSATQTAAAPDASIGTLERYDQYIRRFPRSRHSPRFGELLFEDALRRESDAGARELLVRLTESFPNHPTTERLHARMWRRHAIGKPISIDLPAFEGEPIRSAAWSGRVGLVVVWSASESASVDRVVQAESLAAQSTRLQFVSLCIDEVGERVDATRREKRIMAPIGFDAGGCVREQIRRWGIESVPCVLVIDGSGRLAAITESSDWQDLAERAAN
jgi:hypothetical protein